MHIWCGLVIQLALFCLDLLGGFSWFLLVFDFFCKPAIYSNIGCLWPWSRRTPGNPMALGWLNWLDPPRQPGGRSREDAHDGRGHGKIGAA